MAQYRTAQGKSLDMSALAARNEHVRAVGNMSVNSRGDTIDSQGKIVVPVTKRVSQAYQKTVSERAINNVASPASQTLAMADPLEEEITADDLGFDDEESAEVEQIKAQEASIAPTTTKKTSK